MRSDWAANRVKQSEKWGGVNSDLNGIECLAHTPQSLALIAQIAIEYQSPKLAEIAKQLQKLKNKGIEKAYAVEEKLQTSSVML